MSDKIMIVLYTIAAVLCVIYIISSHFLIRAQREYIESLEKYEEVRNEYIKALKEYVKILEGGQS